MVGLAAAFAAGDGSDREALLRGKVFGSICHALRRQGFTCSAVPACKRSVYLQLLSLAVNFVMVIGFIE